MNIAEVVVKAPIFFPFDYAVPKKWQDSIAPGDRVTVCFRGKKVTGYVFALKETSSCKTLLEILEIFKDTAMCKEVFTLAKWMASYYASSLSKVFFSVMPSFVEKVDHPKTEKTLHLLKNRKDTLEEVQKIRYRFAKRAELLERFLKKKILVTKDLKTYSAQIQTLIKQGWITQKERPVEEALLESHDYFLSQPKTLNEEQKIAFDAVFSAIEKEIFQVFLLHGITGSGKTEVYLQLTEKVLKKNRSVILLVPEVALTSQLIETFKSRFHEPIAIFHHQRSPKQKAADWKGLKQGKIRIALGARSAAFAPAQNLGLIIVDEEHDSSYKQTEEMPTYHARDIAIQRGFFEKAPILLGSATPSIESYYKAKTGKYSLLTMQKRAKAATLAPISIVSMQQEYEKSGGFTHFSSSLLSGIKERMQKGEQTLILFNRRGYRTSRVCSACGKACKCKFCDVSLTFHKGENRLRCHLCGYSIFPPKTCPYCKSVHTLSYKGFGTEHVESALKALLPEVRTLRMDRDTTQKKGDHEKIFRSFRSGKADVLIGTQMIAKGFHFPSVTLVGVMHPEKALFLPDFRAPEQVFQLITQVAGRAGREDLEGKVILQTHLPDDPTMQKAKKQHYLALYTEEIAARQQFHYPPFSRLVKIVFSSIKQQELEKWSLSIYKELQKLCVKDTLYPLTVPSQEKIKGRYRKQCLIRTVEMPRLSSSLRAYRSALRLPFTCKMLIDVDPLSIL